ncbi:MAG: DUF4838 domain-containing protein [Planctomycetes bacterium]|nr:DUF4838 domain-containing protein [Planctomycetota bacterium]
MRTLTNATFRALVLTTCTAFFFAAHLSAMELVKNGGFEAGKDGWWGAGSKGDSSSIEKKEAAGGAACFKLSAGWVCQDKIEITGSKRYRISMKIRSEDAPADSIYVQLSYRGGGLAPKWYGPNVANVGDHTERVLYSTGKDHGWKNFSVVVQAPDGADQALIYLRRSGKDGAAYFDDVRIEPTDDKVTPSSKAAKGGHDGAVNGDFEKGKAVWWGPGLKGENNDIVKEGVDGSSCMKLASDWICQDKISAEGGKNYLISMMVRCDQVLEDGAFAQVSFRGDGVDGGWRGPFRAKIGGHKEAVVAVSGGTHDWKEFSTVIKAPNGADQILIYLRKQGKDGFVYYDNVRIEETDEEAVTAATMKRDEIAAKWLSPVADAAGASVVIQNIIAGAKARETELIIADKGKSDYRIYVGDKADVVTLNAAVELAEYLTKITGAPFTSLAHDSAPADKPLIIVGRENALTDKLCPDIAYADLGNDGFVIRTSGSNLVVTGATPRGTLYGVYWLLDRHLGVKWFDPEFTVIPSAPTIKIKAIDEKQKPRFTYREVFSAESHNDRYAAHNLLNGRSHGRSYTPPAPEIDAWEEWYEVKGAVGHFWELLGPAAKDHPGWKAGGQVLMMSPQVREAIAESIVKKLKAFSDYRSVVFHVNDLDWGWDMDKASRDFANKHGGHPSAPRLDMMIDVANKVRKVFPEARLSFNAYHWSFTPPEGMTVPDYIIVNPMDIHVDYSAPLFSEKNAGLARDTLKWCEIADNVIFWDHTINFFGYIQPTPNLYPIGESIPWLAKQPSIFGYFCEDSWNTKSAEFANLRTWMIARLTWDPSLDYKKLIKEFVDGYYGDAAPYILQYIDAMHESMAKTNDTLREKTTPDAPYLNFEFLKKADDLFVKAHEAVKDHPDFLKHVETTRLSVDFTILLRRFDFMQEAKKMGITWNPDTENRSKRLYENWEMAGVRMYKQGGSLKDLQTMISIERKPASKPEIAEGLDDADWREYSDMTINRYGSFVVPDALASDGGALKLPGNSGGWIAQFRRYKLPKEGEWDVYASIRVDRGNARDDKTAVNLGISPPMGRFDPLKVEAVADGKYHWIKLKGSPMTYQQDDGELLYFQPIKGAVEATYIDRIVAIRHK